MSSLGDGGGGEVGGCKHSRSPSKSSKSSSDGDKRPDEPRRPHEYRHRRRRVAGEEDADEEDEFQEVYAPGSRVRRQPRPSQPQQQSPSAQQTYGSSSQYGGPTSDTSTSSRAGTELARAIANFRPYFSQPEVQQPSYQAQPPDPQGYGQMRSSERRPGPSMSSYGQSGPGAPPPSQMYRPSSQHGYGGPTSATSDYTTPGPLPPMRTLSSLGHRPANPLPRSGNDPMPPPPVPQMPTQSGIGRSSAFPQGGNNIESHGSRPQTGPLPSSSLLSVPFGSPSQDSQQRPPSQNTGPSQLQGQGSAQGTLGIRVHELPSFYYPSCPEPSCGHLAPFDSQKAYHEHRQLSHPGVILICDQCDKDFSNALSLFPHQRETAHRSGYYYCRGRDCEVECATEADRDAHIRNNHTWCKYRACKYFRNSRFSFKARDKHLRDKHGYDSSNLARDKP